MDTPILSMIGQGRVFAVMAVTGAVAGLIYDVFRAARVPSRKGVFAVILDLLYWVAVAALMFAVSLRTDFGQVRAFNILGALLGALIYFLTLSRFVIAAENALLRLTGRLIQTIVRITAAPFKLLVRSIKKPLKSLQKLLHNIFNSVKLMIRDIFVKLKRRRSFTNEIRRESD